MQLDVSESWLTCYKAKFDSDLESSYEHQGSYANVLNSPLIIEYLVELADKMTPYLKYSHALLTSNIHAFIDH